MTFLFELVNLGPTKVKNGISPLRYVSPEMNGKHYGTYKFKQFPAILYLNYSDIQYVHFPALINKFSYLEAYNG